MSQYETGKREPDFQTLSRLEDYFGVAVDHLLGRKERVPLSSDGRVFSEWHFYGKAPEDSLEEVVDQIISFVEIP